MGSSWQGGGNFVLVKRGSVNSRKGGTNSGPVGKRSKRFYATQQNPAEQARRAKAENEARIKAGRPRPVKMIPSGFKNGARGR